MDSPYVPAPQFFARTLSGSAATYGYHWPCSARSTFCCIGLQSGPSIQLCHFWKLSGGVPVAPWAPVFWIYTKWFSLCLLALPALFNNFCIPGITKVRLSHELRTFSIWKLLCNRSVGPLCPTASLLMRMRQKRYIRHCTLLCPAMWCRGTGEDRGKTEVVRNLPVLGQWRR